MQLGVREVIAVVNDFSSRVERDRAALNALNVFPVADNDTGSNMAHTLGSVVAGLAGVSSFDHAAGAVEDAALDGRGNSGLIIGQFLAGFFSAFDADHIELEHGLLEGARWARRSVATPVEGTMLSVADIAAASANLSTTELLEAAVAAVEATPTQLAVLAERNVVDSGAAGLLLFFEALDAVVGEQGIEPAPTELVDCDVGGSADREGHHEHATEGSHDVGTSDVFEIQFRVPSALVSVDELRALLLGVGTDVVIASSAVEFAAHVHVTDPHAATAAISASLEARSGAKAINYEVEPIIVSGSSS